MSEIVPGIVPTGLAIPPKLEDTALARPSLNVPGGCPTGPVRVCLRRRGEGGVRQ